MWMIQKITSRALEIFFPSFCYVCHKEGSTLCKSCLKERKLAYGPPFPYVTVMYSFKDAEIKKIIHAIKYFHRKDLIPPLVEALAYELSKKDIADYTLVPIPMPRLRKYIRGYNHSERIAYELSKQTRIPMINNILTRTSSKKRQVLLHSRSERLKNQHNAFTVTKEVVGMKIILVDDVTTTGATLLEARKVLLAKGALRVEALTIAH